jgi:hypothetical protein
VKIVKITREPVIGRGSISGRIDLKNLRMTMVVFGIKFTQKKTISAFMNEFRISNLKSVVEEG